MMVCVRKNLTVGEAKLLKHEEGCLVAIQRDVLRDGDDYMYLVDFKTHGQLSINSKDLDILNTRPKYVPKADRDKADLDAEI